jgi:thioredoxin reductase (NADPH)
MNHHRIVIIGSGPAGYTAAIYAARAGLEPVVYTGLEQGGQLMTTSEVENYPGYPQGTSGPALMADLQRQALRFGAQLEYGRITAVDFAQRPFRLLVEDTEPVLADAVILATGAQAKRLGLDSEERLYGNGVSGCAVCDGFFYKGKEVAVVGGGDSASEEALYLANIAAKVTLLVRRNKLKASQIMQRRVLSHPKIEVLWNTEVEEIIGSQAVEALRIRKNGVGESTLLPVEALFVAIGHRPNSDVFKPFIQTDMEGYVIARPGRTHTNIPGVFVCGDLQDKHYRQAITAAGTGAMAALDAERYLSGVAPFVPDFTYSKLQTVTLQ